jgi:hypothetical protein
VPSLLLRGKARINMGQYPQARRDFAKIVNRLRPEGHPEYKEAEELRDECDEGIAGLTNAGVCNVEDERTFEVTSEGIRIRNKVELRKLGVNGRSLKKMHMDKVKAKWKMQKDMQKKHDDGRESEVKHAHARADVARKKAARCKALREKYVEARVAAEKEAIAEKKRQKEERRRKLEARKEEEERFMMMEEERMQRDGEAVEEEEEAKVEEDKKDDEEMEEMLALAGRGKSRNKKKREPNPWAAGGSKPGTAKSKGGSKPGTAKGGKKPGTPGGKPGTPGGKPSTPGKRG